ncbi:MAG TPA: hypothetical protein PLP75_13910 [Burkholderiales bacterium]|nr:hypothetical protein [Burkholderiales bacterium]
MWKSTHSQCINDLSAQQIWDVLSAVNSWSEWQADIEYAKLEYEFKAGNQIRFKPRGVPEVKIKILETKIETERMVFLDSTSFPLTKMYDLHEIIIHPNKIEIKNTIWTSGILSPLWRKLLINNIASGIASQTDNMIKYARTKFLESK